MIRRLLIVAVAAVAMAVPVAAHAQTLPPPPSGPLPADPAEAAKVRIGPLFMQPEFGFKNVGLDNNVKNDPANPERDWTATLNMGLFAGLRYHQARFTVKTSTDYVYYAHFREERSIDGHTRYQLEVRNPRVRPWIAMERSKSHGRLGMEIDARAGREQPLYETGVEVRWGFRLGTRLIARQRKIDYLDEETFRGVNLSSTLDAKFREGAVQMLYEISPLSNFRASAEISKSDFTQAGRRNAEDRSLLIGIEGKKDAALEGFVDVGWRERTPNDATSPAFSGIVARGSAAFILWEEVRVAFGLDRDLPWSYEEAYSFYVQQGGTAEITWRPHQRLDLFVTGRHYWLEYEKGLTEAAVLRTDKVYSYGGGFGFFIRGYPGTRLGLTVERATRDSVLADRRYDGTRLYTNVGFSF